MIGSIPTFLPIIKILIYKEIIMKKDNQDLSDLKQKAQVEAAKLAGKTTGKLVGLLMKQKAKQLVEEKKKKE